MKSKIGDETKSSNVNELEALEAIQDRVLWLSTRMIDFAKLAPLPPRRSDCVLSPNEKG